MLENFFSEKESFRIEFFEGLYYPHYKDKGFLKKWQRIGKHCANINKKPEFGLYNINDRSYGLKTFHEASEIISSYKKYLEQKKKYLKKDPVYYYGV